VVTEKETMKKEDGDNGFHKKGVRSQTELRHSFSSIRRFVKSKGPTSVSEGAGAAEKGQQGQERDVGTDGEDES